jgi:hypothetical protein
MIDALSLPALVVCLVVFLFGMAWVIYSEKKPPDR